MMMIMMMIMMMMMVMTMRPSAILCSHVAKYGVAFLTCRCSHLAHLGCLHQAPLGSPHVTIAV